MFQNGRGTQEYPESEKYPVRPEKGIDTETLPLFISIPGRFFLIEAKAFSVTYQHSL